jgi:adenine deaminase
MEREYDLSTTFEPSLNIKQKTVHFTLRANLVDLENKTIYPAEITVKDGKIHQITRLKEVQEQYIMPGFVDSHVHVESSMLIPSEFARLAVIHGTVATISDPHEIANVLGIEGVNYMVENGKKVPFHFFFGAPSCVPATAFETAGAEINSVDIDRLLQRKEIVYLAEMMNYPGVINGDKEVMAKIAAAKKHNKPVDGHAPGLRGESLEKYVSAGISTDHECFKYEEALEKLHLGMKVWIREGSAAKNFDELIELLFEFPDMISFCSDDKHPDSLVEGHINLLVKRALEKGHNLFSILRASSYNIIKHYGLPVGLLQQGDYADFILVNNLREFDVLKTWVKGELVAEKGASLIKRVQAPVVNNFHCTPKKETDFQIPALTHKIRVIEVLDGQLITNKLHLPCKVSGGFAVADTDRDILKMAVVNRYSDAPPALAFIKNFGLKSGAIASCVAHDCHNIVAVGTNDSDLCEAINLIIAAKGGVSLSNGAKKELLPLPVAGIMSNGDAYEIAAQYTAIDKSAKALGSGLKAPFMSLSFMALLVIPQLKLSDKGLFEANIFEFIDVFES